MNIVITERGGEGLHAITQSMTLCLVYGFGVHCRVWIHSFAFKSCGNIDSAGCRFVNIRLRTAVCRKWPVYTWPCTVWLQQVSTLLHGSGVIIYFDTMIVSCIWEWVHVNVSIVALQHCIVSGQFIGCFL